ncbi:PPE domain-containing protein [Mycobacterium sp. Aquia_213]|uniref:PPE domain-containing protein n=1 Tax=Mycobacterium sp. Aquia_213 TaxID=2991728 RepID=UPI0022702682|nr:hypothetical protein [Mycobacterium sp. Aquia_213]WAC90482.1 hypothetical protein LMQ14_21590 [Mycobacterium sp. Aquia_213]
MTAPKMMKVEYEELMARAALLERPIGSGVPSEIPQPPCTLAIVLKAAKALQDGSEDMRKYLTEFDTVRLALAQSLRNAAKAYRQVDEDAAHAVSNLTPLSGVVTPDPVDGPGMLGVGGPGPDVDPTRDQIIDGLHSIEDIAWQLEQKDQGASFERFADQWAKYREQLRFAARERFEPFREWEGDAASTVSANFEAQRKWLETMVAFSGQIADQAQTIAAEFRDLRKWHVYVDDIRSQTRYHRMKYEWKDFKEVEQYIKTQSTSGSQTWIIRFYKQATDESARLLAEFKGKAGLPIAQVNPDRPPPPSKIKPPAPWKPAARPSDLDIAKSHILKPPARPDWLPDDDGPTPVPTPGDQGGVPAMPMMPMMPMTPQTNDAKLAEALKDLKPQGAPGMPHGGGGVKPASFGGAGVPTAPLQSWGEGDPASRPAAAGPGAGPGALGRGVPGGGAMGGGMGGGAPAQAGDKGGKGKRVQGDEDALYTEDRAWTEGVIGLRGAKEVPKQ